MYFNNGTQQLNNQNISGAADEVAFVTVSTNLGLEACDGTLLANGTVKHYQNGWSASVAANSVVELLPGNYTVKMYYHNGTQQFGAQNIAGTADEVLFTATQINWTYSGTIKHYQNGWGTYYYGKHLLPGNYTFKFDGSYSMPLTVGDCSAPPLEGNVHIFKTLKADGYPLPNIKISRNAYSNQYVTVGYTDANGILFTTDQPDGTWKFRAYKNFSQQYITAGPSIFVFQTSEFIAHVKHTDGSDFEGVEVEYNHYSNQWIDLSPKYTGVDGKSSIELFPGNFKFRAKKNFSIQEEYLEITSSGNTDIVEFQTSTFTAHVLMHDGANFAGIEVEYNHYSNQWIDLSPKYTGVDGKSYIELFPGNFKFRAKKNFSIQEEYLEITSLATTDIVTFQTALAIGLVKDCDLDSPVQGIEVEYNHYSNQWIDFSPKYTGADGKSTIELFPGTYNLRAKTIFTIEYKQIVLTWPTTTVEFNPTRVCFQYAGTVKYNHYSNQWITIPCDTYMFPGTYNFRFYSTGNPTIEKTITIAGCAMGGNVAFIHAEYSTGAPIVGAETWYYIYPPPTVSLGPTDANGDVFVLLPLNKTTAKFTLEYYGYKQHITQNFTTNPIVDFATVNVTMKLQDHDGDGTTDDLSGNEATNLNIYKYPTGKTFGNGTTTAYEESMELLPLTYDFRMKYEGINKTIPQDVNSNNTVVFQTVLKTLDLADHSGGVTNLSGDATNVTYYRYPYTGTFGDGVIAQADNYIESMDLFDFNIKYTVNYKGINKAITTDVENVTFQTVLKTINLVDHLGGVANLSGDATTVIYYRYPYTGTFGDGILHQADNFIESMELFDFDIKYTVNYKGVKKAITTDVENIIFQTKKYTLSLVDHNGATTNLVGDATNAIYYRYPYTGTFGDGVLAATDGYVETMDLFDFAYDFTIKYQQHTQKVNSNGDIQYQTGAVDDLDGSCYQYYKYPATGTFTTMMELLPGTYKFYFSNPAQPNVTCTVVAGTTLEIPGCTYNSTKSSDAGITAEFSDSEINVYPNPVSGSATITYSIESNESVNIVVYNSLGVVVEKLFDAIQEQNSYELKWNTDHLNPGVYYVRFTIGNEQTVKPVVVK